MTERADLIGRRKREITAVVDACWKAMIDLDIDAKGEVLIRLDELVAMEESSHEPLQ